MKKILRTGKADGIVVCVSWIVLFNSTIQHFLSNCCTSESVSFILVKKFKKYPLCLSVTKLHTQRGLVSDLQYYPFSVSPVYVQVHICVSNTFFKFFTKMKFVVLHLLFFFFLTWWYINVHFYTLVLKITYNTKLIFVNGWADSIVWMFCSLLN